MAAQRAHYWPSRLRRRRESDLSGPCGPFGNEIRSMRNPRNLRRSTRLRRDKSNKAALGNVSQAAGPTIPPDPVGGEVMSYTQPKCPTKANTGREIRN